MKKNTEHLSKGTFYVKEKKQKANDSSSSFSGLI